MCLCVYASVGTYVCMFAHFCVFYVSWSMSTVAHLDPLLFRQKTKKSKTQMYMDLSYIDPQAKVLNHCYTY